AGLNQITIGIETGSEKVLKLVKKGCSKNDHIKAGKKIKKAGITLSVNIMPGLGGEKHSIEHAKASADVINQINPDFIYLLSYVPPVSYVPPENAGPFTESTKKLCGMPTDNLIAKEICLFINSLDGITSTIKSDHALNLFKDVTGTLPQDKSKMMKSIEKFFNLDQKKQMIYQIGKRSGIFVSIEDLNNQGKVRQVEQKCIQDEITRENLDQKLIEMKQKFV
ncbi:MAG: radical SAM protein, partial [Desulfobacula sp.]|nr:radical SAM protein [Desulfobacula sp.]